MRASFSLPASHASRALANSASISDGLPGLRFEKIALAGAIGRHTYQVGREVNELALAQRGRLGPSVVNSKRGDNLSVISANRGRPAGGEAIVECEGFKRRPVRV